MKDSWLERKTLLLHSTLFITIPIYYDSNLLFSCKCYRYLFLGPNIWPESDCDRFNSEWSEVKNFCIKPEQDFCQLHINLYTTYVTCVFLRYFVKDNLITCIINRMDRFLWLVFFVHLKDINDKYLWFVSLYKYFLSACTTACISTIGMLVHSSYLLQIKKITDNNIHYTATEQTGKDIRYRKPFPTCGRRGLNL